MFPNCPLPTPDYGSIAGAVSSVGNGHGDGPGQFFSGDGMHQVSFGSDSTVWAVDCNNHRMHHFKHCGELIKTVCRALNRPRGVAVSRLSSSIFIGEFGNDCISEFSQSDGAFVRVLDTPGLNCPCGMCLSPDETTLAVACPRSHCIKLVRVDGSEAPRTIGGEGDWDGQFQAPADVRFTPDGQQLVVADCLNSRVQCLALDGSFVRKIPLGALCRAVAVDAAGNIIVTTDNHVKVFSPEGALLHDRLGGLEMECAATGGLAIAPLSGRIAVGDRAVGKVHLM